MGSSNPSREGLHMYQNGMQRKEEVAGRRQSKRHILPAHHALYVGKQKHIKGVQV